MSSTDGTLDGWSCADGTEETTPLLGVSCQPPPAEPPSGWEVGAKPVHGAGVKGFALECKGVRPVRPGEAIE